MPVVLLLQTSSASLGSLALYRSSIQSVVYASRNLLSTARMAFQGIFLMSAFCASLELKPRLQPKEDEMVSYKSLRGGISISARYEWSVNPVAFNSFQSCLQRVVLHLSGKQRACSEKCEIFY